MIITKTPFRMSFFGGGTDFKEFYDNYGGSVISTTIDKYCYVNVRRLPNFFNYTTELVYSKKEHVSSVDDIEHPAIRNAMKMLSVDNIRLAYEADLPARSGLGTSSSFAVGMLNAFYAMKGQFADDKKLADDAIYLERTLCGEIGGIQDQIAAAFGGFNRINFSDNGYEVCPLPMSTERKKSLENNLVMFFTGFTRFSADVQKTNKPYMQTELLKKMLILVDEAEKILVSQDRDIDDFGRLLDETWQLKRKTGTAVTTNHIDELYNKGLQAGALGGKLLGAGGGGHLIFYVTDENKEKLLNAMDGCLHIPFEFENGGTKIIHFTPETEFSAKE